MTFKQVFPNPYDQTSQDFQPETLPLDEVIRQAIIGQMLRVRVALPCQVTVVSGNQKVNVQPLLQTRRRVDQVVENLPVIQNVPVSMPMGQNYVIKVPIAVGDTGLLIFMDRSMDVWNNSSGGIVDPQDSRQHFLQDAVFVPGLVPFANQTTDTTTDLVVQNGKAQLRVLANGKFQITNQQNELIDLINQLLTVLTTNTFTLTMLGPQPFIAATVQALTQIQTKLATLKV